MQNSFISKVSIIIFIFIFPIIFSSESPDTPPSPKPNRRECFLTKRTSMDPFPSLAKCYKYNNEACCTSVHDEYISERIADILPEACLRKYNDFENLMCFGCHPLSPNYLTIEEQQNGEKKRKIKLCKSFARNLWNATNDKELYEHTTIFDNCGFKTTEPLLNKLINGEKYIIPSEVFTDINHFFQYIKIPFFEDAIIEIQNETNENCYNIGSKTEGKLIGKMLILIEIIEISLFLV